MRRTTRREDAAYLHHRLRDLDTRWRPGDRCLAYRGTTETTVARIDGDIVTLANGDALHRSKMRRPPD